MRGNGAGKSSSSFYLSGLVSCNRTYRYSMGGRAAFWVRIRNSAYNIFRCWQFWPAQCYLETLLLRLMKERLSDFDLWCLADSASEYLRMTPTCAEKHLIDTSSRPVKETFIVLFGNDRHIQTPCTWMAGQRKMQYICVTSSPRRIHVTSERRNSFHPNHRRD